MCGIVGAMFSRQSILYPALKANNIRGRDSWGIWSDGVFYKGTSNFALRPSYEHYVQRSAIANMRAEPTTEYVKKKQQSDVQPYQVGGWIIVHNGTIANDKDICARYGFEPHTRIDSWVIAALLDRFSSNPQTDFYSKSDAFREMLDVIVGSYAILAIHESDPETIHYAMNYRPLHLHRQDSSMILTSVPISSRDELLPPYSYGVLKLEEGHVYHRYGGSLYNGGLPNRYREKALVVFSGGLDSTVAAADLLHRGYEVTLLHFDYGCRATGPERQAVEAVAEALGCPLDIVTTTVFTDIIKGSRLTNTKAEFADGEAGAEYAHEWVPARNTILLSIALGIAESRGFDSIALGANLEEAGAYPDNEPEFLRQFNKLIPFAVGDGKRIEILTPVGNLMKHEIVKLGLSIEAPMELSWSCYNAHQVGNSYRHCGNCGPCFMRKTAFEINGSVDPVFRAEQV